MDAQAGLRQCCLQTQEDRISRVEALSIFFYWHARMRSLRQEVLRQVISSEKNKYIPFRKSETLFAVRSSLHILEKPRKILVKVSYTARFPVLVTCAVIKNFRFISYVW